MLLVQDGKKTIEEQSANPPDETTKVTIKYPDLWAKYFYIARPKVEARMRPFDAPAIPLSKRWYKTVAEEESPRATRVEITFENHKGV